MRHGKKFNHLGRTASHRKAMLSNMASSLILHKRINTTVAKAKALRTYVEPLLTKSKEDTTQNRRVVFSYLQNKEAITELFRTIAPKISSRNGGYTRIIKTGFRLGDAADTALIELVDFNELYGGSSTKKTTRRSRRSSSSKKEEINEVAAAEPVIEEVVETKASVEEVKKEEDNAAPADAEENPEVKE
ncbi:MAG: 50S ribosomal protein L17 [Flavobacteriaceae bacterium]|jgi:large subunit ribosomal protein L17|nr:50S ribosomal protein L17 [Flavobacteriaceae bacterium]